MDKQGLDNYFKNAILKGVLYNDCLMIPEESGFDVMGLKFRMLSQFKAFYKAVHYKDYELAQEILNFKFTSFDEMIGYDKCFEGYEKRFRTFPFLDWDVNERHVNIYILCLTSHIIDNYCVSSELLKHFVRMFGYNREMNPLESILTMAPTMNIFFNTKMEPFINKICYEKLSTKIHLLMDLSKEEKNINLFKEYLDKKSIDDVDMAIEKFNLINIKDKEKSKNEQNRISIKTSMEFPTFETFLSLKKINGYNKLLLKDNEDAVMDDGDSYIDVPVIFDINCEINNLNNTDGFKVIFVDTSSAQKKKTVIDYIERNALIKSREYILVIDISNRNLKFVYHGYCELFNKVHLNLESFDICNRSENFTKREFSKIRTKHFNFVELNFNMDFTHSIFFKREDYKKINDSIFTNYGFDESMIEKIKILFDNLFDSNENVEEEVLKSSFTIGFEPQCDEKYNAKNDPTLIKTSTTNFAMTEHGIDLNLKNGTKKSFMLFLRIKKEPFLLTSKQAYENYLYNLVLDVNILDINEKVTMEFNSKPNDYLVVSNLLIEKVFIMCNGYTGINLKDETTLLFNIFMAFYENGKFGSKNEELITMFRSYYGLFALFDCKTGGILIISDSDNIIRNLRSVQDKNQ